MTETVEVELTPTLALALEELREEHGELVVQNDLQAAVHNAIREGHRNSSA